MSVAPGGVVAVKAARTGVFFCGVTFDKAVAVEQVQRVELEAGAVGTASVEVPK